MKFPAGSATDRRGCHPSGRSPPRSAALNMAQYLVGRWAPPGRRARQRARLPSATQSRASLIPAARVPRGSAVPDYARTGRRGGGGSSEADPLCTPIEADPPVPGRMDLGVGTSDAIDGCPTLSLFAGGLSGSPPLEKIMDGRLAPTSATHTLPRIMMASAETQRFPSSDGRSSPGYPALPGGPRRPSARGEGRLGFGALSWRAKQGRRRRPHSTQLLRAQGVLHGFGAPA